MDRTPFWVAALVATVLFVIVCGDARAQTEGVASEPAQPPAAAENSSQEVAPDSSSQGGGATASGEAASTVLVMQDPPAAEEEVQPGPSPMSTELPPTTPPSAPQTASAPPPLPDIATTPPSGRINEAPPGGAPDEASGFTAVATAPQPSAPGSPPTPIKPDALPEAPSSPASRPDPRLGQLLSEVGRRLRDVQGKIDHLRLRIAHGAPPPTRRVIDLRSSLAQIVPMLAALEASVDAAGWLSPRLWQLLQRVHGDLRDVRATAAGLIAALRRAGAWNLELGLLMEELERFRTVALSLPSSPVPAPASTLSPGSGDQGVPLQPARPGHVGLPATEAARPAPRAGDPRIDGPARGRGSENLPPAPWSPSPAPSATASAAGGLLFAAVASLTMLLIGLLLPAIRARLHASPGGRYTVAFLQPLERPG
jgi:hypothetical protein